MKAGNTSLLVLVDSSRKKEYEYVNEAIFSVLDHCGMPHDILDLSTNRVSPDELLSHSTVIIAQENLGRSLTEEDIRIIIQGLKRGVGLVNFDGDTDLVKTILKPVTRTKNVTQSSIKKILIKNSNHYITSNQKKGDIKYFFHAVPLTYLTLNKDLDVLLEGPAKEPALVAGKCGNGRFVQYLLSIKLWQEKYFGHLEGLDDVFWKSIVWAAKKPFIMRSMPPFVTTQIDDCSSSYNHFRYADILAKYGYIPHLELFLDDIDKVTHYAEGDDSRAMKKKYDKGMVSFAAHAFTYNQHIYFDHKKKRDYSNSQIKEYFKKLDYKFRTWKIKPSKLLVAHFFEIGKHAVPYLKERGITYSVGLPIGKSWFSKKRLIYKSYPYGHKGFYYDYQPGYPDFFAISAYVIQRSAHAFAPQVKADFLWGNTIFWDEKPYNDIEGAAEQASFQIKRGLDSLFFGHLMTHEQRIAVLSGREFDTMLKLIAENTSGYQKIFKPFEYVAEYARNKRESHISRVDFNPSSPSSWKVALQMEGRTNIDTTIDVFTNRGDRIQSRFEKIPPFKGKTTIKFPL